MKALTLTTAFCFITMTLFAQTSYMTDAQTAVFYPKDYDASAHSPSPIFIHELAPTGDVPSSWRVRPNFSHNDSLSIVTIPIGEGDDLYGTGEVIGDLRRNDKEVVFWNKDNYGYLANEGKNLYQSHPWVLGLRKDGTAYGVIADNTWKSRLTTTGEIRFESYGPEFRIIVIEGKNSKEVLTKLAQLSGPMELPPLWALGYQQCRYSYYPAARVKEIVDKMRENKIPCDVVWMDIDYMDKFKVFTFDKELFAYPEELHDYVNKQKMKTVYMIDPGVKVEDGYFVYDQGKEHDFFVKNAKGTDFQGRVWPGTCSFPDFARSEVRTWWSTLTRDFMLRGVDGLWNDMNDPSVFEGVNGTMDEDAVHLVGESHYTYQSHLRQHNIYGLHMIRASREGSLLANPDKRPFVLSRSNFLGGQRYGATWTGDNMSSWEHLLQSIPMTLNLGLSGQPFNGPDLGGFGADCDAELLAHWVATGVYFPFVRNHAAKGTVNQEPWEFGDKVLNVYRTSVNRRYMLMPYIYTLFREASVNGLPVMRPLFMADEKDLSLREEQRVYLLGDDLMIIPRWAKTPALPKGDWDIIQFEEQDDQYQAFVALRSGAAVPMANLAQSTVDYKTDSLTVIVNPDAQGNAVGTLYEDAGDGFAYRSGDYSLSSISAKTIGNRVEVSLTKSEGNRTSAVKWIRVGIVTDGKVTYSPWTEGSTVTMNKVDDKQNGIDVSKLKWSSIDPSKEPTTQEKLRKQMAQMAQSGDKFEW
ncbi:MAG: DUF5110 domain-containing protein [Bacteroidales bacterium]|nr:DUF5110 domain-containing protein [Bacteroidales bacterium]